MIFQGQVSSKIEPDVRLCGADRDAFWNLMVPMDDGTTHLWFSKAEHVERFALDILAALNAERERLRAQPTPDMEPADTSAVPA